jgi:hypothetical protein
MIKIDKEAFAKDEFFNGTYVDNGVEYPFIVGKISDFETKITESQVTWVVDFPTQNRTDLQKIENKITDKILQ